MLSRRRTAARTLAAFLVVLAGALVVLPDRDDTAVPIALGEPATGQSDESGDVLGVDVGDRASSTAIEPVAGLVCRGPEGQTPCVDHVTEVELAPTDEVRIIRGRIVVAGEDGTVRAHSLRDGDQRWRTAFGGPVTLHPDVAQSVPVSIAVSSPGALDILDLDSGNRIGPVALDHRQVATIGPWIVVDEGDRLVAYSVGGRPGWTRELDGASVVLSTSGSYVRRDGTLTALFNNTGETRFETAITGPIGAITQEDGRVMLVTDEPAEVRSIAPDGTTRSRTTLPGTRLAWAAFTPDGSRLVTLTQDDDGNLQWLSILDRFQPDAPRHLAVFGRRSPLDPVLDDRMLLVPTLDGRADVVVVDLDSGSVVNRVRAHRPLTDLGLAGARGFATIDDLGTLRVQAHRAPTPTYSVALGADGRLLQARPLLVRTQRAVVTFQDLPPTR